MNCVVNQNRQSIARASPIGLTVLEFASRLSLVPSLVKMRSTRRNDANFAGTYMPTWANIVIRATCLKYVLFPLLGRNDSQAQVG